MINLFLKKTLLTAGLLFLVPFFSFAQSVDLRYSPSSPEKGQLISVSVSSFDADLNTSEISWFKDGKLEKKGTGVKSFNFNLNADTNIKVSAKTSKGIIERTVNVPLSDMDLLWEATSSYEPPFYKGKVLPIKTSTIKVVAIPQIKNNNGYIKDSGTFVYSWEKDGSNFAGQSGYGRNSFVFPSQILDKSNSVTVRATHDSGQLVNSTTMTPFSPEIHFYELDLAYGPLYNKAIRPNTTINKNKINILAEPFFINTGKANDPTFKTEWKVNDNITKGQDNLLLLNLGSQTGQVDILFDIENKTKLLSGIKRSLRLNFTNQ